MTTNRIRTLALGVGVLAAAGIAAVGLPAASQGDLDARLQAFGVPAGAELVAAQANADGDLLTVVYRDATGATHTLGGVERLETPPPK